MDAMESSQIFSMLFITKDIQTYSNTNSNPIEAQLPVNDICHVKAVEYVKALVIYKI